MSFQVSTPDNAEFLLMGTDNHLDTDLKNRIQAFKDEKKGSKIAVSNVMDETPG